MGKTGLVPRCQVDYLVKEGLTRGEITRPEDKKYMDMIREKYCATCADIECGKHVKITDENAKRKSYKRP